jgi:hypothetical protein
MAIYRSGTKNGSLLLGIVFLLVGTLFFALGVHGALDAVIGSGQGAPDSPSQFGLQLVLWLRSYEVRVPGDGSVAFVCALRHKVVTGTAFTRIEKQTARIVAEGDDARELRFYSNQGSTRVRYFDGIAALIAAVQAMNPRVEVSGSWPDEPEWTGVSCSRSVRQK